LKSFREMMGENIRLVSFRGPDDLNRFSFLLDVDPPISIPGI